MRQLSLRLLGALVGSSVLVGAESARAEFVNPPFNTTFQTTLDTLLEHGANSAGITFWDKRYYDFWFSSTGDAPVAASDVGVQLAAYGGFTEYHLRFSFDLGVFESRGVQTTDVVIGYRVDELGPRPFESIALAFAPGLGGPDVAASVTETIRTADGSDLAPGGELPSDSELISVFNDGPAGPEPSRNFQTLAINPTRSLLFEKDMIVSSRGGGADSRVAIHTVDNIIVQVPEPSAAALVGAAGIALLARRRRG